MQTGKFIIMIMLLLASIQPATTASATVLTSEEMAEVFHDLTSRNSPWPQEQLQVHNFIAKPATLILPDGAIEYRTTNQPHPKYLGRKVLQISVLVNGKEEGKVKMIGDLHLYGDVACATRRINRHEKLTKNNIKMVRRDITMLDEDVVQRQAKVIGKRIKTSLQPGDIIKASQLDEPVLVKRGDMVTIIAKSQGLRATAPGEAKKDGAQGDTIRVKNLLSRKYIFAEVVDNGVVQVAF